MAVSMITLLSVLDASHAQQQPPPYMQYSPSYGSRFSSLGSSKTPRGIQLSVMKNISEDVPVGELLFNFRAEDKDSPSYNLT